MTDDSHAILQTIAYSDIFDHPLTAREIHRYLFGLQASFDDVCRVLEKESVLVRTGKYFTLPGRETIIPIRLERETRSRKLLPRAMQYGRILASLPFVRMVALTGSLAVLNVSKKDDFDYMLITVPGRVWTARAFAVLFNRVVKLLGHTICPNLIVSEKKLDWPLHDLYSARELCQMIPVAGFDRYQKLLRANQWAKDFLPNAFSDDLPFENYQRQGSVLQKILELLLGRELGDRLENWEMNRKIARFSQQEGFGEETVFNADLCQGNFHHHRNWTRVVFEDRLRDFQAYLPLGEG